MVDNTMDALAWVRNQIEQADTDLLREMGSSSASG